MTLSHADFPAFFHAVHGCEPFPWQVRLAQEVVETGVWPSVLDLPTGVGKTATLDIAVFALAVDATREPARRRSPRRIVMVVDRRVVVDQAALRALHIAAAMDTSTDPVVQAVAESLRRLGGRTPLEVTVLRGGIPRGDTWVRSPEQPMLVLSTVDQVGSRLLFRGYGINDRMQSVHAGLLGQDALLLLDEVHLSQPFATTLRTLRQHYLQVPDSGLPCRFCVVEMSATPRHDADDVHTFRLDRADHEQPVLVRRLSSSKPAQLDVVTVSGRDHPATAHAKVARRVRHHVDALVAEGSRLVGVVLNRVDGARIAAEELQEAGHEVLLLTGRMRPMERDHILAAHLPRIMAGRDRATMSSPLIVVATQCIEAGADLDLDALITECASLDALRQRFGRVDRRGELGSAPGVILVRSDQIGARAGDDPVYGAALEATWQWLQQRSPLDFGVQAMGDLTPEQLEGLCSPAPAAPVLLPATVRSWSMTSPTPVVDPEVGLWLHGDRGSRPEVQVAWRGDLDEDALEKHDDSDALLARVMVAPPGSAETLSLPLSAFRRWLAQGPDADLADVDGATEPVATESTGTRPVIRWRGDETELVAARDVKPGDTVIVPATYGGLRDGSFDPDATTRVVDLGDAVQRSQRGRVVLRLHPGALFSWLPAETAGAVPRPPTSETEEEERDLRAELAAWAAQARGEAPQTAPWLREALDTLAAGGGRRLRVADHLVLVGRRRSALVQEVSTEDDTASFTSPRRRVALSEHLRSVRQQAGQYGHSAGLPPSLASDLALAGHLHDLGKADPRFQQMLLGGDPVATALLDEPLAKSPLPALDHRARKRAQRRSGYPVGTRHELLSVALVEHDATLQSQANDWDLVLHLVGSHHGWCRPFGPPVEDPADVSVHVQHEGHDLQGSSDHGLARLDSGVSDRFWRLQERYGAWGLAWLEALLRLADHAVSAAEQVGGEA